jgi:hypothetical protein
MDSMFLTIEIWVFKFKNKAPEVTDSENTEDIFKTLSIIDC